jgi:hypothetical protein
LGGLSSKERPSFRLYQLSSQERGCKLGHTTTTRRGRAGLYNSQGEGRVGPTTAARKRVELGRTKQLGKGRVGPYNRRGPSGWAVLVLKRNFLLGCKKFSVTLLL